MDARQTSSETYAFAQERVLPDLSWPAFDDLFLALAEKRRNPPDVYVDTFPALTCSAAGGDPRCAVPLAAAWLLNVIAGRIFDDAQDEEGEGKPWSRGNVEAASYGLFALGAANSALSHLQADREIVADILRAFGNVLALSARAQAETLDLAILTVERYFAHVAAKTGMVFATGAWAGARLAGPEADDSAIDALHDFGLNLGMAIQIVDDCEDLVTSDLHRRHFTLPVAYALAQRDHPRHPLLASLLENGQGKNWVENVVGLLAEMNAVDWSLRLVDVYRAKALAALEPFPEERVAPLVAYATVETITTA